METPKGGAVHLRGRSAVPVADFLLKGIYPEFQVIRGLSQKIPADLLSYDKIQS